MEIGKHTWYTAKIHKWIKARLKLPFTIPFQ